MGYEEWVSSVGCRGGYGGSEDRVNANNDPGHGTSRVREAPSTYETTTGADRDTITDENIEQLLWIE